jgi:hypothetical protein
MDLTPNPITKNINKEELKTMLLDNSKNYLKTTFCWHKWIYWKFGNNGKIHRVCKKCGKKQQNGDVLNTYNIWIKDIHFL